MNNKGQVLVLFLLLLPVILILFAFVIDKSYLLYEESKLNNIGNIACDYILEENDINKLKQLVIENDNQINNIKLVDDEITLKKEIKSLFGSVIGIDTYKIKSTTICKN